MRNYRQVSASRDKTESATRNKRNLIQAQ